MIGSFKDAPYSGGGSITVKGNIQQSTLFSTRLFVAKLPLEDLPIYISYSVSYRPALQDDRNWYCNSN